MSIYTEKLMFNNFDGEYPAEMTTYPTGKKGNKIKNDPTKHYPNKGEASLLRKIKSSTGLSEEEIRADKKYRKMLSEAQKVGQKAKRSRVTKWYQTKIKEACQQTKLAPQHPETLRVLGELLKDANPKWLRHSAWMFGSNHIMSAKKAIELYGK